MQQEPAIYCVLGQENYFNSNYFNMNSCMVIALPTVSIKKVALNSKLANMKTYDDVLPFLKSIKKTLALKYLLV